MQPYAVTEKNDAEIFHYHYRELKDFLIRGFTHGDCGPILTKRKGKYTIYRGFGTIENPSKTLYTMNVVYNEIFDGKRKTALELITPVKYKDSPLQSHYCVLLDLSDFDSKPNIQKL